MFGGLGGNAMMIRSILPLSRFITKEMLMSMKTTKVLLMMIKSIVLIIRLMIMTLLMKKRMKKRMVLERSKAATQRQQPLHLQCTHTLSHTHTLNTEN